jgi:hypothetical protein
VAAKIARFFENVLSFAKKEPPIGKKSPQTGGYRFLRAVIPSNQTVCRNSI